MKWNKGGFSLIELVFCILAVVVVVTGVYHGVKGWLAYSQSHFGRNAPNPTFDQMYFVTAADKSVNEVIAMPWMYGKDGPVFTDRRIILKVDSNACEAGTWIVVRHITESVITDILSPPVVTTTNVTVCTTIVTNIVTVPK